MIRKIKYLILLLISCISYAQVNVPPPAVFNAAGTTAKVNGYYYGFNIGEPITGTAHIASSNHWNYFTQGFLQPDYKIGSAFSANIYKSDESCQNANDGLIAITIYNKKGYVHIRINPSPSSADTNSNIFNLAPGIYTITATDSTGQSVSQVVDIIASTTACPVTVYHAFSPNNDGLNDLFIIDNILAYPDNHVYIFDRWGILVWEKVGYNNTTAAWNGKDKAGADLTSGTYFYIIEHAGPKILKNWVELTR